MSYKIKICNEDDFKDLKLLIEERDNSKYSKKFVINFFENFDTKKNVIFLVKKNKNPVGLSVLKKTYIILNKNKIKITYWTDLYVSKNFQGSMTYNLLLLYMKQYIIKKKLNFITSATRRKSVLKMHKLNNFNIDNKIPLFLKVCRISNFFIKDDFEIIEITKKNILKLYLKFKQFNQNSYHFNLKKFKSRLLDFKNNRYHFITFKKKNLGLAIIKIENKKFYNFGIILDIYGKDQKNIAYLQKYIEKFLIKKKCLFYIFSSSFINSRISKIKYDFTIDKYRYISWPKLKIDKKIYFSLLNHDAF